MMEANAVRASNFEQTIRTFNVRFYERRRIGYRVIVMRLGGKMHDGIMTWHHALQQSTIADVAHHKMDPPSRQILDVTHVGSIRELIEHCHMNV